jgi:dihydropteroate synthase
MGVLNVTPDSFSDGGQFNTLATAVAQAYALVEAGADIIDIGGQSTRPGATPISSAEELKRVLPLIQALRSGLNPCEVPISVDTTYASVARAAIEAGADLINDISGATFDPHMLETVANLGVPIVLMHIRGTPQTMQQFTNYSNLVAEICQFLQAQITAATAHHIDRSHIILDPGIGFAKNHDQNLEILRSLHVFRQLGYPTLVGPSRKRFIGHILNQPNPTKRIWGTAAACCAAISGFVDILRVHDVAQLREVCQVADAIWREN